MVGFFHCLSEKRPACARERINAPQIVETQTFCGAGHENCTTVPPFCVPYTPTAGGRVPALQMVEICMLGGAPGEA
jgi:hypothetical protein